MPHFPGPACSFLVLTEQKQAEMLCGSELETRPGTTRVCVRCYVSVSEPWHAQLLVRASNPDHPRH